MASQAQ